jgi:hypothetical protein
MRKSMRLAFSLFTIFSLIALAPSAFASHDAASGVEDLSDQFTATVTSGVIHHIGVNFDDYTLVVYLLGADDDGELKITLNSKIITPFDDGIYFVLVDHEEVDFEQMGSTLHIEYGAGTEKIEIVGGQLHSVTVTSPIPIPTPTLPPAAEQTQESEGGGCLIATAAFGSEMAPQVQFLREIRDNTVLQTESGSAFMAGFNQFYYSFSPAVADYERENQAFKETVKLTLTPLLTSLTLLQYADIDSEYEILGYGISVILLNIGIYFVAPAVLLSICIRKMHQN